MGCGGVPETMNKDVDEGTRKELAEWTGCRHGTVLVRTFATTVFVRLGSFVRTETYEHWPILRQDTAEYR